MRCWMVSTSLGSSVQTKCATSPEVMGSLSSVLGALEHSVNLSSRSHTRESQAKRPRQSWCLTRMGLLLLVLQRSLDYGIWGRVLLVMSRSGTVLLSLPITGD